MAIFEAKKVTLSLDKLLIEKASDRFWSDAEPYVVPVFYKVDGERYEATFGIFNSPSPRDNTSEREQGVFHFNIDTLHPDSTPEKPKNNLPEKDYPYTYIPPGKLLGRGSRDDNSEVDVSDISFTTTLIPIPLKIVVFGNAVTPEVLSRLEGLLSNEDGVGLVYVFFERFNLTIQDLLGLDENFESCPQEDFGDFLQNIEAQFNCLMPGTIAGTFLCMENDDFDEKLAKKLQNSLKDEVEMSINNAINDASFTNPIPVPERFIDSAASASDIKSDLTGPFVLDIFINLGLMLLGAISLNVILFVYGLWNFVSNLAGGADDVIGNYSTSYDHTSLINVPPDNSIRFSSNYIPDADSTNPLGNPISEEDDPIKAGGNDWALEGSIKVH